MCGLGLPDPSSVLFVVSSPARALDSIATHSESKNHVACPLVSHGLQLKPFPITISSRPDALNTRMRYSELRLLRWGQVDLNSCTLTVGRSKTESGTGRLLPLNDRAGAILCFWSSLFPLREPSDFVFPAERYWASGDGATVVYESDPTRPIGRGKEAWESAKIRAGGPVDSTTSGTLDVLECLKQLCHSPLLLRSWAGVLPQRCEWRGATGTLDRPRSAKPSMR